MAMEIIARILHALAATLTKPGLKLEDVFKQTREKVLALPGENQVPWETSSITGDFIFKVAPAEKSVVLPIFSIDADFEFARSLNTVAAWDLFLKRYGKTSDKRVGVAIQERKKIPPPKKEDYSGIGIEIFQFAIKGQADLKLRVLGYSYSGSKIFSSETSKREYRNGEFWYVVRVDESEVIQKSFAQWCVLDLTKKWNLLPKGRSDIALCDDHPLNLDGYYEFTPRNEKHLETNSEL